MLVRIIMLVITVPIQSQPVKLDLSSGPLVLTEVNRIKNVVSVTRTGTLHWNGEAVDARRMQQLLLAVGQASKEPETHVRPDPDAPYSRVDELLAMARKAGFDRIGFVGNETFATF